jgi:hypothetical protein
MLSKKVNLGAGARVRVRTPGPIPTWSKWEPCQRTSNHVKKRLQQMFFKGDRRVEATVQYIGSEHERTKLRSQGRVKIELRDPAGSSVIILAETDNLVAA